MVTSKKSPVELISKKSGTIQLIKKNEKIIEKNEVIAFVNSEANYQDVLLTETFLLEDSFSFLLEKQNINLGALNKYYNDLKIAYLQNDYLQKNEPYLTEVKQLNYQITLLSKLTSNIKEQLKIHQNELELAQKNNRIDSILFYKIEDLTLVEYRNRCKIFLSQKRNYKNQEVAVLNNQFKIKELIKQKNNLILKSEKEKLTFQTNLHNTKNELLAQIKNWKENYLFIAPEKGQLVYLDFLENEQYIPVEKQLFSIIPSNTEYYAQAKIAVESSGKVKIGQDVNIKLDNYPSKEFGIIRGTVKQMALLPVSQKNKMAYQLKIQLNNGLTTTYNKTIPSKQSLTGKTEIITQKRRLLERFLGEIRNLIRN